MMLLSWCAATLGLTCSDSSDVSIQGVSTDTRTIQAGDLFVALRGEHSDGHDYITAAVQAGAVAIIVDRPILVSCDIPVLTVIDTRQALLDLAAAWRLRFTIPIVAITGSCGKTSTRALLESILQLEGPTLASEKSYNNAIGVPLTLLRLQALHRYAVIEVGTSGPGEIASLVRVVQPTVAILTNVAAAHLSGLGSIEGIAAEKSDIFSTLPSDGVAVVNADDTFAPYWLERIRSRVLRFGINHPADMRAIDVGFNQQAQAYFTLVLFGRAVSPIPVQLRLVGKHQVYNALAAAAAATALGMNINRVAEGLSIAMPVEGRLNIHVGYGGARIIDDSYNANPGSVRAAIAALTSYSHDNAGVRILVLGDMKELGTEADYWHAQIGREARDSGIHYLLCYGEHSHSTAEAFGENGWHFSEQTALLAALRPLLNPSVTVLIKGSHAMGMRLIVEDLLRS